MACLARVKKMRRVHGALAFFKTKGEKKKSENEKAIKVDCEVRFSFLQPRPRLSFLSFALQKNLKIIITRSASSSGPGTAGAPSRRPSSTPR